jgi:hypothetical protein
MYTTFSVFCQKAGFIFTPSKGGVVAEVQAALRLLSSPSRSICKVA